MNIKNNYSYGGFISFNCLNLKSKFSCSFRKIKFKDILVLLINKISFSTHYQFFDLVFLIKRKERRCKKKVGNICEHLQLIESYSWSLYTSNQITVTKTATIPDDNKVKHPVSPKTISVLKCPQEPFSF